jgi:hypothetical protein
MVQLRRGTSMKKTCAAFTCALMFILTISAAYGEEKSSIQMISATGFDPDKSVIELKKGELFYKNPVLTVYDNEVYTLHPLLEDDSEYEESPARRFEIIFIISIPLTLALSFAGLAVYKAASDTWGDYQTSDYVYLSLSTLSLSLSVAIHDHRVVYKKSGM